MTISPSVKSIEHSIEKYRTKATFIDDKSALHFANDLKTHILNKTDDQAKAISVLSTILRFSKPNDSYAQIFDELLIDAIFKHIISPTPQDLINSSLKILGKIVNGEIFSSLKQSDYIIPFLNAVNSNLSALDVLSAKLFLENIELMQNSLIFINGYLDIDHNELNSINHLTEFILHLQRSEFLVLLLNYKADPRFKVSLEELSSHTQTSFHKIVTLLLNFKVDSNSKYQSEILNIILNQVTKTEVEFKRNYILENFSLFHLIDIYFFLENTNITFKKAFHQQVLFNSSNDQKFPLPKSSLTVSNFLMKIFKGDEIEEYKEIQKHFFLRDILQYNLITKFLEIWVESKAEVEDFDNLFLLIEILVKRVNDSLNPEGELNIVDKLLQVFKDLSYEKLREIQLNNFKTHVSKTTKVETQRFNKILNDQVFEFVRNQRFLQLAKGSWVYADLPSFKNSSQLSSSYFFIILSPNFKQLLYKEYKATSAKNPNIDKSGTPIDISAIANFEIEEIHQVDQNAPASTNSRLINLVDKTVINKITLLNRKNRTLFSFYAKKDDSLIWLDGLNLLIGNYDHLSSTLTSQLNKLYDVRKTIQLLNFDDESSNKKTIVDDAKINDLQFLESLTTNFYYS